MVYLCRSLIAFIIITLVFVGPHSKRNSHTAPVSDDSPQLIVSGFEIVEHHLICQVIRPTTLLHALVDATHHRRHHSDRRQARDHEPGALERFDKNLGVLCPLRVCRQDRPAQSVIVQPAQKQHAPDGDSHGVRDVRRRQGYSVYRSDMSGFHRAKNRAEVGRLENRGRRHVPCSGI